MCKKIWLLLLLLVLGSGGAYAAQAKLSCSSADVGKVAVQDAKKSAASHVTEAKLSAAVTQDEQSHYAEICKNLVAGIKAGEQPQTALSVLHTLADEKHYLPAMLALCAYYNSIGDADKACAYGERIYEVALASFETVSSAEGCDKALSPLVELLKTLKNSRAAAKLWCRAVKLQEAYYAKVDELNKSESCGLVNEKKQ